MWHESAKKVEAYLREQRLPYVAVSEAKRLSLKHNHISYNRGRSLEIDQELQGLSELFPLTGNMKGERA